MRRAWPAYELIRTAEPAVVDAEVRAGRVRAVVLRPKPPPCPVLMPQVQALIPVIGVKQRVLFIDVHRGGAGHRRPGQPTPELVGVRKSRDPENLEAPPGRCPVQQMSESVNHQRKTLAVITTGNLYIPGFRLQPRVTQRVTMSITRVLPDPPRLDRDANVPAAVVHAAVVVAPTHVVVAEASDTETRRRRQFQYQSVIRDAHVAGFPRVDLAPPHAAAASCRDLTQVEWAVPLIGICPFEEALRSVLITLRHGDVVVVAIAAGVLSLVVRSIPTRIYFVVLALAVAAVHVPVVVGDFAVVRQWRGKPVI